LSEVKVKCFLYENGRNCSLGFGEHNGDIWFGKLTGNQENYLKSCDTIVYRLTCFFMSCLFLHTISHLTLISEKNLAALKQK
jgi:hypothetical protein